MTRSARTRLSQNIQGAGNASRQANQNGHNRLLLEGQPLPERYMKGSTNIVALLKSHGATNLAGRVLPRKSCDFLLVFESDESVSFHYPGGHCGGIKARNAQIGEAGDGYRWDENTVFVGDIERIQTEQIIIPSRVWLKVADCSGDLWAGELHLSTGHNLFQSVRPLAERELNLLGIGIERGEDLRERNIERRPKVVNGVSDDKAQFLGNGFVLFESYGGLVGFWVTHQDEATRLLLEEFGYLPIEILDVMLGPFEFDYRAVQRACHG
jgi:hypothetical protein